MPARGFSALPVCFRHVWRRTDSSCLLLRVALVKKQVDSQIKGECQSRRNVQASALRLASDARVPLPAVRDFSRAQVSIAPADFATWNDARAELLSEAKRCAAFPVSPAPATRSYPARVLVSQATEGTAGDGALHGGGRDRGARDPGWLPCEGVPDRARDRPQTNGVPPVARCELQLPLLWKVEEQEASSSALRKTL